MCVDFNIGKRRAATADECALLKLLLSSGGEVLDGLSRQLDNTMVEALDGDGSLRFYPESTSPVVTSQRIPVEASYPDSDGVVVHVLLHVLGGFVNELEVFREDSRPVQIQAIAAQNLVVELW